MVTRLAWMAELELRAPCLQTDPRGTSPPPLEVRRTVRGHLEAVASGGQIGRVALDHVLCNLPDKALEGELANEAVCRVLVPADLAQRDLAWAVHPSPGIKKPSH